VPWAAVVPNAVGTDDLLPLHLLPGRDDGYLVQLARIDESKGQHVAIEVARRAGIPLVLAGKVDAIPEWEAYFRDRVRPFLDGDAVTWIPEVRGREKAELLARARAMDPCVDSRTPRTTP
jgi:glycosyltransferase involved in cell wall biosynthesis